MWTVQAKDRPENVPPQVNLTPDPYDTTLTEEEKKLFSKLIDGVKTAVGSMEGRPQWLDSNEALFLNKISIFDDYTNAQNVLTALLNKLTTMEVGWSNQKWEKE